MGNAKRMFRAIMERFPNKTIWVAALAVLTYYVLLFVTMDKGLPRLPAACDDVMQELQSKATTDPADANVVMRLGEAYKVKGQSALAKKLLCRALRLNPELYYARHMLAEIHESEGQLWTAYREFLQAYKNNPEDVGPALRAADVCRMRGDYQLAESLYGEIAAKRPDMAYAHYWLGVLQADGEDSISAINSLETAVRLDPSLTDAKYRLTQLKCLPPDRALRLMREHWWKIVLPLLISVLIRIFVWRFKGMTCFALLRAKEVYLHVYLMCLAILLFSHYMKITRDPALHGEEMASAYGNVVYFEHHVQSNYMATNFSGTFFFWLGSHILPLTVQSQRLFKIIVVSLLPCLVILLLKRSRPNAFLSSQLFSAIILMLIPSISWLSIMATECCVDSVLSFAMLLVALGLPCTVWLGRDWVRLGIVGGLATLVAHFYGSSLILLPVTALVVVVRGFAKNGLSWFAMSLRVVGLALAGLVVGVLILWPLLYYNGKISMFLGGGRLALSMGVIRQNLLVLLKDLFVQSESYMVRGDIQVAAFPLWAQGAFVLGLAAVGGYYVIRTRRAEGLSLIAILILSMAMGGMASNAPGIRRIVPAVICFVVLAAIGLDKLKERFVGESAAWGSLARGTITAAPVIILAISGWMWVTTYNHVHTHYRAWLQREFVQLPGKNYEETVESLIQTVQTNKIALASRDYNRDTILLLYLMCNRRGVGYVPPDYDGEWDLRLPQAKFIVRKKNQPGKAGLNAGAFKGGRPTGVAHIQRNPSSSKDLE